MKTPWKDEITPADIEKFLAVHGQHGVKTLSLLGRKDDFYTAVTDKLGQELMKDVMVEMERLLLKIIEDKADENEKADYRAYRKIFEKWSRKIKEYRDLRHKIKEKGAK